MGAYETYWVHPGDIHKELVSLCKRKRFKLQKVEGAKDDEYVVIDHEGHLISCGNKRHLITELDPSIQINY